MERLRQTCESCPSQWQGFTTDGREVHIRYRHSGLTVMVVDIPGEVYVDGANTTCFLQEQGDGDLGFMDESDMIVRTGIEVGRG